MEKLTTSFLLLGTSCIAFVCSTFSPSLTAKGIKKRAKKQETLVKQEAPQTPPTIEKQVKPFSIRVLLEEQDAQAQQKITITADHGFILESPLGHETNKARLLHKKLQLIVKNNKMYVYCKDMVYRRIKYNTLAISPIKGILHFNDKSYHGSMILRIDEKNNKLLSINKLDLDEYVYSVLRYESLSYWPHEMQKVQAIASRTYALYHIKQMKAKYGKDCFYDIKNNNMHQVYNGFHDCVHLKKAVVDTHNLVLTYKGAIALTMFDICCGGIIPAHMKYKDLDKPYLFRDNQCIFCKGKQHFEWKKTLQKEKFFVTLQDHPRLAKKIEKIGRFVDITIKEKDKAGILHTMHLKGSKTKVTVSGNELKACLSSFVKSLAFTITRTKNKIEIFGKGFGHNTGLCQLGARELVARGKKFQEILAYYYPKTKLVLYKKL